MIGLFGIVALDDFLEPSMRNKAFEAMLHDIDRKDFFSERIDGKTFSIGITLRKVGENKDLALRKIDENSAVAFSGYGRLAGEKPFQWADAMIDRLVSAAERDGRWDLEKIEGSFECLIVGGNSISVASDRLGSKRLFYYDDEEKFIFAPDVHLIARSRLIPIEQNLTAAFHLLVSGFFPDDSTLIENLRRFPYASVFTKSLAHKGKGDFKRYWNFPIQNGQIEEITEELIEEHSRRLESAIDATLQLDHRAVVPLSGGLDSRTIACYVAQKNDLKTITYDLSDEVAIAKKVCNRLGGRADFFTNEMLDSDFFQREFYKILADQKFHVVPNQYFYTPLFKKYFQNHPDQAAIYDGVYMGLLFSAPYTYTDFNFDDYIKIYCGGASWVSRMCRGFDRKKLLGLVEARYKEILNGFDGADGVAKSQLFYASGRLRRYVCESYLARENYCYVYKPGFDYDLMDFGFSLDLSVRKGQLYAQTLRAKFPMAMSIGYKDSYGNRPKTILERWTSFYKNMRLKASYGSNGVLKYYRYQADRYFYKSDQIDKLGEIVTKRNYLEEIIDDTALADFVEGVKRKQYLFNFFQRIFFLQSFYARVFDRTSSSPLCESDRHP